LDARRSTKEVVAFVCTQRNNAVVLSVDVMLAATSDPANMPATRSKT
jgi:hypothetical protein